MDIVALTKEIGYVQRYISLQKNRKHLKTHLQQKRNQKLGYQTLEQSREANQVETVLHR